MRLIGDPAAAEEQDTTCWVCCDAEAPDALLSTGCACRGSGGRAHARCLVASALHDVSRWTYCPTCRQDWTGEMEVCLAQARWDSVRERDAEDPERLFVANNLAVTLQESAGDYTGALALFEEVLAVRRRTLGDAHPDTLDSITNLALHHTETGNFEAALTLSEEVVASHRKLVGASQELTDEEVAHSIGSLAVVHNLMGNCELAYTLHVEALAIRQRLLGEAHLDTLNSRHGLGQCLVGLGRHEEGLAMLDGVASTARRVFGEKHPTYQHFASGLAAVRERVAETEAQAHGKSEADAEVVTASAAPQE